MIAIEDDNEFLAESFIKELKFDGNVDYNTELTPEYLASVRKLCAVKHMARKRVNMSLEESAQYTETEDWKSLWEGVWSHPPTGGKSV